MKYSKRINRQRITAFVSKDIYNQLQQQSKKDDVSMSSVINQKLTN